MEGKPTINGKRSHENIHNGQETLGIEEGTLEEEEEGKTQDDLEEEEMSPEEYNLHLAYKRAYTNQAYQLERAKDHSLQDFQVTRLLGNGGFGHVYLVKNRKDSSHQ